MYYDYISKKFITFLSLLKDPDILPECESLPHKDPSIFYKRYLKKMRDLGEVGFPFLLNIVFGYLTHSHVHFILVIL